MQCMCLMFNLKIIHCSAGYKVYIWNSKRAATIIHASNNIILDFLEAVKIFLDYFIKIFRLRVILKVFFFCLKLLQLRVAIVTVALLAV